MRIKSKKKNLKNILLLLDTKNIMKIINKNYQKKIKNTKFLLKRKKNMLELLTLIKKKNSKEKKRKMKN